MKRLFFSIMVITFASAALFSEGAKETGGIVASTGWTAAFAYAAGARDVHVLAPYDMRHPAEYELRPSDLQAVRNARYVIYAGYEQMVTRLREAADGSSAELIQITTQNDLGTIETSVRAIAGKLGTGEEAERNLSAIRSFFGEWKSELSAAGANGARVIIHNFQRPLAGSLGISPLGGFGPAPLEARQIRELSETRPELIIDNWHNPVAVPLRETVPGARYVTFINFPTSREMRGLIDILAENRKRVGELLR